MAHAGPGEEEAHEEEAHEEEAHEEEAHEEEAHEEEALLMHKEEEEVGAEGLPTEPPVADAAATPAVVGPLNEYTIFDVTPEQVQARIAALEARAVVGAASPLNNDENLELAQLLYWFEERKFEQMRELGKHTDDELNAASAIVTDRTRKIIALNPTTTPWEYSKDYTAAKRKKIDYVKTRLQDKLASVAALTAADKTTLISETEARLADKDHTLESMTNFATAIDALDPAAITDLNKAKQQIQNIPLVIRNINPVKPKTGKAPSGAVKTNKPQKLEIPKVNPFVLESKTVMGQMVEAFFKSFMLWPWQIAFEMGMRIVSEIASKPVGAAMTVLGATFKFGAHFLEIASFGYINMKTLHTYGNGLLKVGAELDGTLPLIYSYPLGKAQQWLGKIFRRKDWVDAGKVNASGYTASDNFSNSIVLTPLRIIPIGGALVWNTLNATRTFLLASTNFGLSGANNTLAILLRSAGYTDAANRRGLAAHQNNDNFRFYRDATLKTGFHMLTHPFSAMLAPAPQSKGGYVAKQAGYAFLEEFSPWFGPGNMGRWLSETYKRGTIPNNPSIKQVDYFVQQAKQLAQIKEVLSNTKMDPARVDEIIKEINRGLYSKEEMDAYIARIKTDLKPNMTHADAERLNIQARDDTLTTPQNVSVTRVLLDWISTSFVASPLGALGILALALSPIALLPSIITALPVMAVTLALGIVALPFGLAFLMVNKIFGGKGAAPVDDDRSVGSDDLGSRMSDVSEVEDLGHELPHRPELPARIPAEYAADTSDGDLIVIGGTWDNHLRQDPDMSSEVRSALGIPHWYEMGDASEVLATRTPVEPPGAAAPAAAVPLHGMAAPGSRSPRISSRGVATPQAPAAAAATTQAADRPAAVIDIRTRERLESIDSTWPNRREDISQMSLRNVVGNVARMVGKPIVKMYAASKKSGTFSAMRAAPDAAPAPVQVDINRFQ